MLAELTKPPYYTKKFDKKVYCLRIDIRDKNKIGYKSRRLSERTEAVDVAVIWQGESYIIMADKYKSESQKPPNNPLLSGAGHGFPFDTFQGSSLLVPVSQDNPSVLSDQVGEPDKFVGQDLPSGATADRFNDPVNIAVESRNDQASVIQPSSSNSGYVRLFNAFFGGGKSEEEVRQDKEPDQAVTGSVSSTPRSFSPYVQVPNFQTVTPALQVPPTTPTSPAGSVPLDSNPINSAFFSEISLPKNRDVSFSEPPQPSVDGPSRPPSGFNPNFQNPGYQFQNPGGNFTSSAMFSQNQPTSDLNPVQSHVSNPLPPPVQPNSSYNPSPGADLSKPPLYNPNAPPLFRGDSSKTYRLCHNKRPVYAPIPGLTLSSSASAPFMQPSNTPASASAQSPINSQPSAYSVPSVVSSHQTVYSSATPPETSVNPDSSCAGQSLSCQRNILSYFYDSNTGDNSASQSVQNCELKNPYKPVVMATTRIEEEKTLFAPISNKNPNLANTRSPVTVFNPVAVHPSGSLPENLQPQVTNSQPASGANIQPASGANIQPASAANIQPASAANIQPASAANIQPASAANIQPASAANIQPASAANIQPASAANVHPVSGVNSQPVSGANSQSASATVAPSSVNQLAHVGRTGIGYRPPYHHWFYKKESDSKEYWYPFSMTDSVLLEQTYQSGKLDENSVIATDGGRYDVSISKRLRTAVYWKETPKEVRRCSWFYKNQNDSRYKPYDENTAYHLEEEYKKCVTTDVWRKRVDLSNEEYIIFYSSTNMAHFDGYYAMPDGWEGDFADGTQPLPSPVKMVKRGISDDFDIDDGEAPRVDHLVFVVHGIGSACDLKFRTIEEAVDIFRSISHKLIKDHFSNSIKQGLVNRIEILPISWHSYLHGETTGLDKKLESITLKSIPRLRNFTNDTLLDILFYTSPVYCEKIVQQVGWEIKTVFDKFKQRNPGFRGGVSLVGHSLGSLILFDMLCHQKPAKPFQEPVLDPNKAESVLTRRMSGFVVGNADARQPFIDYPQLPFQPIALFALGSPIGMFVTVRGIDTLGQDFKLPTCPRFYNIFHPFDPVAYRLEALLNPELSKCRPVLIPHHKGRKRMHLELKETISRVGADLKQRLVDSIRSTWNTVFQLTSLARADDGLEQEVDKVIERQIAGSESAAVSLQEQECLRCDVGQLNMGRRVDYVLQEAPLESFNEYVSAIRSHLIYWDSEDTVLMILREIYNAEGIILDSEIPTVQENVIPDSPSTSAPDVGWNITEDSQHKPISDSHPPTYGFINN